MRGDGVDSAFRWVVVYAKSGKHSQKPGVFYEHIEKMFGGPYLELFSRTVREGWSAWGNEIPADEDHRLLIPLIRG